MRASKTVNGVKSTFEYVGGKLVYEKRGNMDIYYQYDSNGNLSAIRYVDGTEDNIYYTVCNSRGDVEAIYGGGGGLKARYIYDTWGNTVKIVDVNGNEITDKNTVGYINPIRYRGYYYDAETGFYYLQSRYYDPETGRFLNADGYVSTGQGILGTNMFAYCGNNPVNMTDKNGKSFALAGGLTFGWSNFWNPVGWIALAGAAALTAGYSIYKTATASKTKSTSKAETKEKSIPYAPPKFQAYFPKDPNNFNPKGLFKTVHPGTKNGRIIEWRDPNIDVEIFEWNEDFKNGEHYHALLIEWDGKHNGPHYLPGTPIPEPWNSIYFGG